MTKTPFVVFEREHKRYLKTNSFEISFFITKTSRRIYSAINRQKEEVHQILTSDTPPWRLKPTRGRYDKLVYLSLYNSKD